MKMSEVEVVASKSNVTNGKAITSLVLGILSMVFAVLGFLGFILSVIGLTIGIMGLREIKNLKQKGHKIAVSGIICSGLGILLQILGLIMILTYFGTVS